MSQFTARRQQSIAFFVLLATSVFVAACQEGIHSQSMPRSSSQESKPPTPTPPISSVPVAEDPDSAEAPAGAPASNGALSALAQTITQAYDSAKSTGQTAATSARDWIMNEITSRNRWEYRVVSIAGQDASQLEARLNELGRDGWQCFHVQVNGSTTTFFMQRLAPSISRNIPMSDLLKVLPYLGIGQGEQ